MNFTRLTSPTAKTHDDGFTLVELLIVVLIIGILAAIAVPVYLGLQTQAKHNTVKADVNQMVKQVQVGLTEGALTIPQTASTTPITGYSDPDTRADGAKVTTTPTGSGQFQVQGLGGDCYTYTYASTTGQFAEGTDATCAATGGTTGGSGGSTNAAPTFTTTSLPAAAQGITYSQTLATTGATNVTYTLDSGTLPAGLSLSTAGVISGTPTATTDTTSTFTIRATNADSTNLSSTQSYTVTTYIPPSYTASTATATGSTGNATTVPSAAATGDATITYALAKDSYPAGASDTTYAVSATGAITGTPTVGGTYTFHVTATNSYGSAVKNYTVTVSSGPVTTLVTDFENTSWSGSDTTTDGVTISYSALSSYPFYANSISRCTTSSCSSVSAPKIYAGNASGYIQTNGSQYSTGNIIVTLSNVTVGKSYTLSGYYTYATLSGNVATNALVVSQGNTYSSTSNPQTSNCTSNSSSQSVATAKGTFGSFTGTSCTATATTISFMLALKSQLGSYTQNGWFLDNISLKVQ